MILAFPEEATDMPGMRKSELDAIVARLRNDLDRLDDLGETLAAARLAHVIDTLTLDEDRIRDASAPFRVGWSAPDE